MPVASVEHGEILELRLRGGRGNSLRPELLRALSEQLRGARQTGAPAILLSSEGRSFSTGLDLRYSLACDRAELAALMKLFHDTLCELLLYPAPTVAAVGGHALAGGALLALACDRRLMAIGGGQMGIHGARLGIGYPDIAIELVGLRLARAVAERVLHRGEIFGPELARELGLVDLVCERDQLRGKAFEWLDTQGTRVAFAANKAMLLAPTRRRLQPMDEQAAGRFVEHWFGEDTQQRLAAAVARLSSNSGGDER